MEGGNFLTISTFEHKKIKKDPGETKQGGTICAAATRTYPRGLTLLAILASLLIDLE